MEACAIFAAILLTFLGELLLDWGGTLTPKALFLSLNLTLDLFILIYGGGLILATF
jgi:hypothetical protein